MTDRNEVFTKEQLGDAVRLAEAFHRSGSMQDAVQMTANAFISGLQIGTQVQAAEAGKAEKTA